MIEATASAPGKLILLGEYAVLDGAPAVVAAVDRQAQAKVRPAAAGLLVAPEVLDEPLGFQWTTDGPEWNGSAPDLPDQCLRRLAGLLGDLPPFELSLSTRAFVENGCKLGIGSSAALTVAIVDAMLAAAGRTLSPDRRLALALACHRDFQGGRGSGADIAASASGGLIVYRPGPPPDVRPVSLPEGLVVMPIWTGRPASTTGMLDRLASWRDRNATEGERLMGALAALAERGALRMQEGDAGALIDVIRDYAPALEALARASGLPIVSPVHARLATLAARHGLAYKPSGAGDGDFGIAFGLDADAGSRFRQSVLSEGFRLPLDARSLAVAAGVEG